MPGPWPLPWVVATLVPASFWPWVQVLLEATPPSAVGAPARLWFSLTLEAAPPLGLRRLPPEIWDQEAVARSSSPKASVARAQLLQVLAVP